MTKENNSSIVGPLGTSTTIHQNSSTSVDFQDQNQRNMTTTKAMASTAASLALGGETNIGDTPNENSQPSADTTDKNKDVEDKMRLAAIQEAASLVKKTLTQHPKRPRQTKQHGDEQATNNPSTPANTSNHSASECVDALSASSTSPPNKKSKQLHSDKHSTRVSWEERLQQLKAYKVEHGDLLIPIRYKANPSLGKFVHNTREQYKLYHKQSPEGYKKKCSLTPQRIQQLNELGFAWTTQRTKQQQEDWKARLQQLRNFKATHGHCMVPHGYVEDPSFAEWIHRQRTTYASLTKHPEQNNRMMQERMQQLKDIGFNFTVHSDKWIDHWSQLKAYKEKHGDCQVPTHFADNPKLGRWVHTQRHQNRLRLRGKKSCMTQERMEMLDQLGFSWEIKPAAPLEHPHQTWWQQLEELTAFEQEHGHFLVDPQTQPHLHAWCLEQKKLLLLQKNHDEKAKTANGNAKDVFIMHPEHKQALLDIGFDHDTELLSPAESHVHQNIQDDDRKVVKKEEGGKAIATIPFGGQTDTPSTRNNAIKRENETEPSGSSGLAGHDGQISNVHPGYVVKI